MTQRIVSMLSREPLAASALLVFALLFLWHWLTVKEVTPLPPSVGAVAIETIAEVWCVSALPALWLVSRRGFGAIAAFAAALVPPLPVQLLIFTLGSVIPTSEEQAQHLQAVQFALGSTLIVGSVAACVFLLLRTVKAKSRALEK